MSAAVSRFKQVRFKQDFRYKQDIFSTQILLNPNVGICKENNQSIYNLNRKTTDTSKHKTKIQ